MRLILALRLPDSDHAKALIRRLNGSGSLQDSLVDLQIERRYPALKNMITFFNDSGILPAVRREQPVSPRRDGVKAAGQNEDRLLWCEVETDRPMSFWESLSEAEVILVKSDFEAFVSSIRGRAGTAYILACEKYARSLILNVPQFNGFAGSASGASAMAI